MVEYFQNLTEWPSIYWGYNLISVGYMLAYRILVKLGVVFRILERLFGDGDVLGLEVFVVFGSIDCWVLIVINAASGIFPCTVHNGFVFGLKVSSQKVHQLVLFHFFNFGFIQKVIEILLHLFWSHRKLLPVTITPLQRNVPKIYLYSFLLPD